MFRNNLKYKLKLLRLRKKGIKFGQGLELGSNIFWGSEPYLITIGDNVRITSNVSFITHDGSLWTLRKMHLLDNADYFGRIIIGNNVNIGMNSAIMPGVTIGDNSIIGFGSVVTKDVEPNSVYAGVPARKIETIEEYYNKKKDKCDFTKNLSAKDKKKYLMKKYGI